MGNQQRSGGSQLGAGEACGNVVYDGAHQFGDIVFRQTYAEQRRYRLYDVEVEAPQKIKSTCLRAASCCYQHDVGMFFRCVAAAETYAETAAVIVVYFILGDVFNLAYPVPCLYLYASMVHQPC